MTLLDSLAALPDDAEITVSVRVLRSWLEPATAQPAGFITTEEAARRFSYRPETWARWAAEGVISGAFRDRWWRLPLAACEAHVARLSEPRRRRRHPWSKAEAAHPVGGRPARLEVV